MSGQLATRARRWGVQSLAAARALGWCTRDPEPRHKWMAPRACPAGTGAEKEAARHQREGKSLLVSGAPPAGARGLQTRKSQPRRWSARAEPAAGPEPQRTSSRYRPYLRVCQLFLHKTGREGGKVGSGHPVGLPFPSTGPLSAERQSGGAQTRARCGPRTPRTPPPLPASIGEERRGLRNGHGHRHQRRSGEVGRTQPGSPSRMRPVPLRRGHLPSQMPSGPSFMFYLVSSSISSSRLGELCPESQRQTPAHAVKGDRFLATGS